MKKITKGPTQATQLLVYLGVYLKVTTLQCRDDLSIMSPAARIRDLRKQGWPIGTSVYQQIDGSGVSHEGAQYYLQEEKLTPEQQNILSRVLADN